MADIDIFVIFYGVLVGVLICGLYMRRKIQKILGGKDEKEVQV